MRNTLALREKCEKTNLKSLYKRYMNSSPGHQRHPPSPHPWTSTRKGKTSLTVSHPFPSPTSPCPATAWGSTAVSSTTVPWRQLGSTWTNRATLLALRTSLGTEQHLPAGHFMWHWSPRVWALGSTFNLWHITLQSDLPRSHVGHPFPPPRLPTLGTSLTHLLWAVSWPNVLL